jgi:hypothetical protein
VGPLNIGGAQAQAADPASRAETGITGHQRKDPREPIGRHVTRPVERAPDVLVMDGAVDERDHPAETGCQSPWLEVAAQEFQQLVRGQSREFVDAHLVCPDDPAFGEPFQQPQRAQLLVADHMRNNVFHAPAGAEGGRIPVL